MSDDILRRIQAGRERWLDLDGERRVKIRRPAEATWPALRGGGMDPFLACVVDWDGPGFTTAGILGSRQGSVDDKVPFSAAVWRELVLDNVAWCAKVAEAVTDDIRKFADLRESASGN